MIFISHPVFEILLYRSMLTILLSALIIINLLNWIPVYKKYNYHVLKELNRSFQNYLNYSD